MERSDKPASGFKRGSVMSPEKTRLMCGFIKKLCERMRLKSNVMCSALVFFHRFHARHVANGNGVPIDDFDLATACVFLACKVEENIQKLERILDTSHELRTHDPKPLSDNKEMMWKTRERTLICERVLLDTISFNVAVDHAHFHASQFARTLAKEDKAQARDFVQIAYNVLNDSLSTNLCLKYPSDLIGAAAVRLAGRFLKFKAASHKECLDELEAMEARNEIFGFSRRDLMAVEDELISTYEAGDGGSGDTNKRIRNSGDREESIESLSPSKMQIERSSMDL